jgi:predicted AAA+ superfamily ATPase
LVEKGPRTRDLRSPLDWLSEAHVVNIAKQLDEHVSFPLMEKEGLFRIYLGDVGMFTFQSNVNPVSFVSEDGRNTLSGIFYENFVAEELTSRGFPLFYWRGKGDSEFEFILDHGGYAIPVDVKKRKGPLRSLDRFMEHNRFDYAVKVSGNNYGFDESRRILTIPFYQFFLYMDGLLEERRLSMESLPLCNGPDTDVGLS